MRNSYLLYAMGAGLAFTACSSEENVPNVDSVLEKDQSFYVNVAITTNSDIATRAYDDENPYDPTKDPDFEKGEASESVVGNVYFVFYDSNGIVVGEPVLVPVGELGTAPTDSPDGNVLRSYTSIVKVDVNKGEGKPAQVMCYVNPVSTDGLASTLQKVETVKRDKFQDNDKHFSMSNSVYYKSDAGTTSLTRAVEIANPDQLFTSKEAAEKAVENDEKKARVVINVERYAAKVNFSFGKEDVVSDYVPANSAVTLTFVPERWDVNATDRNVFVTKAFRENGGLGSPAGVNMTYAQVANELKRNDWKWNSADNSRSYWAFSPAYYSQEYPSIAYDVTSKADGYYNLNYLSFDEIVTGTPAVGETPAVEPTGYVPTTTPTPKYVNETTVARIGLDGTNPAAAIASAVLCGHYEVALNGTVVKTADSKDLTFYTMGTDAAGKAQVFFGATLGADNKIVSEVAGAPTMIEYMADKETVLLVHNTNDNTYAPLTKDNLANVFGALVIERPSEEVYTELGDHSASRTVTLQIGNLSNVVAGYTLCINVGNGAQEIGDGANQVSLLNANVALARATQWANRYNEGRAFFNIPIKHLGWYAGTNPNVGVGDAVSNIDYSQARVGDFGLVRNHVYSLVVNQITGLGTAVSEPGDPLVPPVESKDYYVAYRLNILNWAIVPIQNVDL